MFAKVEAFAATPAAGALPTYEAHFVSALQQDFKRGGLALSEADRTELQRLLDADAALWEDMGRAAKPAWFFANSALVCMDHPDHHRGAIWRCEFQENEQKHAGFTKLPRGRNRAGTAAR